MFFVFSFLVVILSCPDFYFFPFVFCISVHARSVEVMVSEKSTCYLPFVQFLGFLECSFYDTELIFSPVNKKIYPLNNAFVSYFPFLGSSPYILEKTTKKVTLDGH